LKEKKLKKKKAQQKQNGQQKKSLAMPSMSKERGACSRGGLCAWLIFFSFIKGWALFLSKKTQLKTTQV
jgi:hypothetical protein